MTDAEHEADSKRLRTLDCHQEGVVDGALGRDMCVLAGAGTGKTHTMTRRIQRLAKHGRTVRCFSHANKTCDELRSRLQALGLGHIAVTTMHAYCKRLIVDAGQALPPVIDDYLSAGLGLLRAEPRRHEHTRGAA